MNTVSHTRNWLRSRDSNPKLAVNRSPPPVQKWHSEFFDCRLVPLFRTVCRRRCCTTRASQTEGKPQPRVDFLHVHRVQNAQTGLKIGLVESHDLADIDDTIAIEAGGPRRKSDVTWRS